MPPRDPEDEEEGITELADPPDFEEDGEGADVPRGGLGALGQLATAVLVVVALIVIFMGSSAVLRRIFG